MYVGCFPGIDAQEQGRFFPKVFEYSEFSRWGPGLPVSLRGSMSKSFSGLMNQRSNPESARLEKSETACMKITAGVSLESAPSIEQKTCEMLGAYAETSECELLQAARLGDDKAFIELCRRISPSVKRRIYSILQNQEDTEDALQDTLLRAYVHLNGFRGGCKFGTWITTIATNTALMILRKKRARSESHFDTAVNDAGVLVAWDHPDQSPNPEQHLERRETIHLVRKAVQRLRPGFRVALDKHYGNQCPLSETAEALGISIAATKSRLLRGRHKLRASLRKYVEQRDDNR
jgi:RNA polymerase sigma factor (sigma-70 family)